ncbi:MAG TPA: hypothetical protein DEQ28_02025 [Clostridiales bacterium]|nr:hypothetical protein [Clostridiales bacterium]
MPDRERILATLLMNAALPLTRTLLAERPGLARRYGGWNRVVQFQVVGDPDLACYLEFTAGQLAFVRGRHRAPTIDFRFRRPAAFSALLTGKPALPAIRGALRHPGTLLGVLPLLLGLTILLPGKRPRDPAGRELKVRLLLYFITVALSQLNQAADPGMRRFTAKMPDRIFQWSVEPDGPAAYLRVCQGKTRAGKGLYPGRRPFVHMRFESVDDAFLVLTGQVDNVEAMRRGMLVVDGSPEYSKDISAIMKRIEALIA